MSSLADRVGEDIVLGCPLVLFVRPSVHSSGQILLPRYLMDGRLEQFWYKNSTGDEIANVNIFTTISHTYFKIPKKRTYFV